MVNHHRQVPFRLLRNIPELSCGDSETGNLIVEGDNLEALKALLPYYAGQVKCVYIDPPYNTGNEGWVYNDNVTSPVIREWLGKVVGREGETLDRHDRWLCMMYPRLALLKEFLREDGAIFISIDDNEVALLRMMLNEIFGEQNFLASIIWQKKQSPQSDAINLSDMHDYVIAFARRAKANRQDAKGWNRNLIPRGDVQDSRFENPDNDPRGPWTSTDYTCNKTADERPNLFYPIVNPNTGETIRPSRTRVWGFDKEAHERNVLEGRVWWGANGHGRPRIKKYRSEVAEGIVPTTWWTRDFAGDNQESRRELRGILGGDDAGPDFATPKPSGLIQRILQIATDRDSIVLDSFAGSGSTGHAVLRQNALDGGSRRFILVEMEPVIARRITSKRVRRVAVGYQNSKGAKVDGLGGGFRYCELGQPLSDQNGKIRPDVAFSDLARHVYFSETGSPLPKDRPVKSPFLGEHRGLGLYLLYNGILGDKSAAGGNVLTREILAGLPKFNGPKVIYCAGCLIGRERLEKERVVVRQTPYEIRIT